MASRKSEPKQEHSRKKLYVLSVVGTVLALVLVAQTAAIFFIYKQNHILGADKIQLLIATSIQNMFRDAVIEPSTNKVYIPDGKLVFQGASDSPRLLYAPSYMTDENGATVAVESVTIADKRVVNGKISKLYSSHGLDSTFEFVPELQACTRQIQLLFAPASENSLVSPESAVLAFTKAVADGRTLYVYTEKDSPCKEDNSQLMDLLRTVESY